MLYCKCKGTNIILITKQETKKKPWHTEKPTNNLSRNSKKPDDHHQVAGLQRFMQGGLRHRWAHHRHRECCHHHQGCCHHPRYRHRPPASALRCSPCASSGCPWADSSRRWSSRSEPPSTRQPSSHHCRGWQRGRYRGCQSSPPCPRG